MRAKPVGGWGRMGNNSAEFSVFAIYSPYTDSMLPGGRDVKQRLAELTSKRIFPGG
jgi:hypothetical protein